MEKRAGHGKGVFTLLDYSGSSLGDNVAGFGVGHGYGPVLRLERIGVKQHTFVSSSPAFEVSNSIGYAFGHGRCFYRSPLPFVDPFIFDDNNNDEQDDLDDIVENRHYLIRHDHHHQQGRREIESSSSSSSDNDDGSSTTSSRPDSGIGL